MEWGKLGKLTEIKNGYAFKSKKYQDAGVRVIRITNVQKGYIEDSLPKFYSEGDMAELDDFLLFEGDILISLTGNVGRVARVTKEILPAALNQRVACIKPGDKITNDYLFYMMNSNEFESLCMNKSNGVAQKNLGTTALAKIKIPVPPINIQKQIVEVLDEAQRLIDNRKEQINFLDDLIESILIYTVGPKSENYKKWEEVDIGELGLKSKNSMRTGPFGSDLLHSEFVSKGIYVLGIDNVVNNRFEWGKERYITEEKYQKLKRYTVKPGDVLISIMGTTGRSAVVPKNIPLAINTKHLACITPNKDLVNPYFLSLSIHSNPVLLRQIELRNKGAIMNGLNLTIIKELKIKLPPIQLQNQFAEKVALIESQKQLLEQSLTLLEDNYNSLTQRAFKGELFN